MTSGLSKNLLLEDAGRLVLIHLKECDYFIISSRLVLMVGQFISCFLIAFFMQFSCSLVVEHQYMSSSKLQYYPCSYGCSFCNCVEEPEKVRTSTEHHTRIVRSQVQTPLKSWIFQASLCNCENCIHNCEHHILLVFILYLQFNNNMVHFIYNFISICHVNTWISCIIWVFLSVASFIYTFIHSFIHDGESITKIHSVLARFQDKRVEKFNLVIIIFLIPISRICLCSTTFNIQLKGLAAT